MYHFVTGFTSKLAGTERGITEPKPTFSTLFGEPFMPMDPAVYANMLGEKIAKYGTSVYLVNTGWAGGSAQELGKAGRMKLRYTRAMVTAALNGELANAEYEHSEIFNVEMPKAVTGCPLRDSESGDHVDRQRQDQGRLCGRRQQSGKYVLRRTSPRSIPTCPRTLPKPVPRQNNCATQNPGALPPGTSAGKGHASSLRAAVWPFPAVVPSQF